VGEKRKATKGGIYDLEENNDEGLAGA